MVHGPGVKQRLLEATAVLLAAASLIACSEEATGQTDDLSGDWRIEAATVEGVDVDLSVLASSPTLRITQYGVVGTAACNTVSADRSSTGPLFPEIRSTAISCDDDTADAAVEALLDALAAVSSADIDDDSAVLTGPDARVDLGRD